MASGARYIPFDRDTSGVQIAMDTGEDSIFLWYSKGRASDPIPETVAVHTHGDEVDETIVMLSGEGYYLHGETLDTVVKSSFRAPCVLYLPAGEYHRIVTISQGERESVLMYSPAGSKIDRFVNVIARAHQGEVKFADLREEELPAEPTTPRPDR